MTSIGPGELIVVLVIALLVLGPKRLPDAGRSVGKGIREFKDAISGADDQPSAIAQPAPIPTQMTPAPAAPAPAPAPAAAPVAPAAAETTGDVPQQQAS